MIYPIIKTEAQGLARLQEEKLLDIRRVGLSAPFHHHVYKQHHKHRFLHQTNLSYPHLQPIYHQGSANFLQKKCVNDASEAYASIATKNSIEHNPQTLRIAGSIYNTPAQFLLLDSGSTHNFIQERLANHPRFAVDSSQSLPVTVGNGEILTCPGRCDAVPPLLSTTPVLRRPDFNATFFIGTDASGVAMGAVLVQHGHPLAFFRKPVGRYFGPIPNCPEDRAGRISAIQLPIESKVHPVLHVSLLRPFQGDPSSVTTILPPEDADESLTLEDKVNLRGAGDDVSH
ncbi:hypothetical protein AKJ16_DCAP03842 [Drosera capensis]